MIDVEIETILKKKMGLKLNSIGKSNLNRAINRRLEALALTDTKAYIKKLKSSTLELNKLIEEVVIPETWFFRDNQPFEALAEHITTKLINNKRSVLRLLSAPCATGEEAYSIVITLLEAGIPAYRFKTYAIDISSRSLELAKKAEYREKSFRGNNLSFREKYFKRRDNISTLNKSIRNKVHFFRGNILDPIFMQSLGLFDVLLCRNVLIYLDAPARQKAISNLERQLVPDGLLFVGNTESGLMDNNHFVPAPYPKAFAFYKRHFQEEQFIPKSIPNTSNKALSSHSKMLSKSYKFSTTTLSDKIQKASKKDLIIARQMIDEGRLKEAAEICNNCLRKHGPSSEAYFLLGMIRNEEYEPDKAVKLLRKAVYLAPDHVDALFLLMLLAEQSGDLNRAKIFKERIERLQSRT